MVAGVLATIFKLFIYSFQQKQGHYLKIQKKISAMELFFGEAVTASYCFHLSLSFESFFFERFLRKVFA